MENLWYWNFIGIRTESCEYVLVWMQIYLLLLGYFHDASGLLANSHRKSFMTKVIKKS